MRKLIWLVAMFVLVACNQDKGSEQVSPVEHAPAVVTKTPEALEISDPDKPKEIVQTVEAVKVDQQAAEKVVAKPTETETRVVKTTQDVEPVAQKNEPKIEPKNEPVIIEKKVVAPLVQGKAPLKSKSDPAPSNMMLKADVGDAVAGKKVAKKCMSCHTFNQGGKKKTGPNLFGIVGKAKGADAKFKYGTYLKDIGGVWDEASLKAWLKDSKGVAKAAGKKSKMPSQKIKGKKADDLIAYLKTLK